MENYLITAVLAAILAVGVFYTVKHFKGQSGCCAGGGYKPKKKKLPSVIYRKTFKIDGMHCEHCKIRIEETVNDIMGVAGKVDLKKCELVVSYAQTVDDSLIIKKIERAGYRDADIIPKN